MASTFKNRTLRAVGTSPVDVGAVVSAGVEVTIIGLSLANLTGGGIKATIAVNDGTNTTNIVKNVPIPTETALVAIGGDQKVVLMAGDKLIVTSDTASSLDVVMSFLEIT
ncbi:MAG: hypothetical protein CL464_11220 [Acidimicrobiaceae bacterium]|jgi:hypothetical protein|nr:hypothetical protein [Acidimicrobiaceae bacterium]|tara:strand:- start:2395 stop:2724 length:330 start_codon:yes stop_codon:yes gene_type:complete